MREGKDCDPAEHKSWPADQCVSSPESMRCSSLFVLTPLPFLPRDLVPFALWPTGKMRFGDNEVLATRPVTNSTSKQKQASFPSPSPFLNHSFPCLQIRQAGRRTRKGRVTC